MTWKEPQWDDTKPFSMALSRMAQKGELDVYSLKGCNGYCFAGDEVREAHA